MNLGVRSVTDLRLLRLGIAPEPAAWPGLHRGLTFNLQRRSNRHKQSAQARVSLGVEAPVALRVAFVAWLTEMRILSEDPGEEPVPVAQARPRGLEAWWTLDDGELEMRTSHQSWPSLAPPQSVPYPVPWAPHLVLGIDKDAPRHVIEEAHQRQMLYYGASCELLTDKHKARAERRLKAICAAFAVLNSAGAQ